METEREREPTLLASLVSALVVGLAVFFARRLASHRRLKHIAQGTQPFGAARDL